MLNITEAKNAHFLVCKRTGFAHQRLRDFVKMTLTRIIDCREDAKCLHVVLPVRNLRRNVNQTC